MGTSGDLRVIGSFKIPISLVTGKLVGHDKMVPGDSVKSYVDVVFRKDCKRGWLSNNGWEILFTELSRTEGANEDSRFKKS